MTPVKLPCPEKLPLCRWFGAAFAIVGAEWRGFALLGAALVALAAFPLPLWLQTVLSPLFLLAGLYLSRRAAAEGVGEWKEGLAGAFLGGLLIAGLTVALRLGQLTVALIAIIFMHRHWEITGATLTAVEHWDLLGVRLANLAGAVYVWIILPFFMIPLAYDRGLLLWPSFLESAATLSRNRRLWLPIGELWAGLILAHLLLPTASLVWLGLFISVLGPPVAHAAYREVFGEPPHPPKKQKKVFWAWHRDSRYLPVKNFLTPQALSITATPQENIACPVPSLCSPSQAHGPYRPPVPWPTPS